MRDDVVPRINPIWEKTIHVSVCFTSYSMKCIYCFDCTGKRENEAHWSQSYGSVQLAYTNVDQKRIPSQIRHRALSDYYLATHQ